MTLTYFIIRYLLVSADYLLRTSKMAMESTIKIQYLFSISHEANDNAVLIENKDESPAQQLKDLSLMGALEKVNLIHSFLSGVATNFFLINFEKSFAPSNQVSNIAKLGWKKLISTIMTILAN